MSRPVFKFNNCTVNIFTAEDAQKESGAVTVTLNMDTGAMESVEPTTKPVPEPSKESPKNAVPANQPTLVGDTMISMKQMMITVIKSLLDETEKTSGRNNKAGVARSIFRIIRDNAWFMTEHKRFRKVVIEKCKEFYKEAEAKEFAKEFIRDMFLDVPELVDLTKYCTNCESFHDDESDEDVVEEDTDEEDTNQEDAGDRTFFDSLKVGDIVDALDTVNKWYEAEVIGRRDGQVQLHYTGWDVKWDEWISTASRVAKKGTHTDGPYKKKGESRRDAEDDDLESEDEIEEDRPKKKVKKVKKIKVAEPTEEPVANPVVEVPKTSTPLGAEFQGTHTKFEEDGTTTVTLPMRKRVIDLINTIREAQAADKPVAVKNLMDLLTENADYMTSHPALSISLREKCETFLEKEYSRYHEFTVPFVRKFYPDNATLKELCEPPEESSDDWEEW